tara:strand:+ start:74 stop:514 length:441 start_codon:yes stop_codon:yes gene_type:complete
VDKSAEENVTSVKNNLSIITDENVGIFSNYFFRNINYRISAANHIGIAFKNFNKKNLQKNIDSIILNYLNSLAEYLKIIEGKNNKIRPNIWDFWEKSELNIMFKLPATKKNKILYNAIKNIFEDIFDGLDFFVLRRSMLVFLPENI